MKATAGPTSTKTLSVAGPTAGAAYEIGWYNAWDLKKGPYYYAVRTSRADADQEKTLYIPVGELSRTNRDPDNAWDGADAILVIEPLK